MVVVADGAKARFFTVQTAETSKNKSSPALIENEVLVNPDQDLPGQELFSGPQSQAGHHQQGKGPAYSYDDHRQQHALEYERRFAQEITEQILTRTRIYQIQELILIAEPRILGLLREVLTPSLPKTLVLNELNKNLCHLNHQELHEYLVKKDLLPELKKASR